MRALLVAALVFVAALAGCSGKKADADIHYTCSDGTVVHADDFAGALEDNLTDEQVESFLKTKCPKAGGSGSGSTSNSATLAPNKFPVLKLKVTDDGGNATNVTLLDGNLTFDATGSFDPDGQLSAIAITVKDSNQTRTKPLYDLASKAFKPATFKFDRAGIVNVTIRTVDDRAGFNTTESKVYVNTVQVVGGSSLSVPASDVPDTDLTHPCLGATPALEQAGQGQSGPIVHSSYFTEADVTTGKGVSFIEAVAGADNLITICAPDGTAISTAKQSGTVVSTQPILDITSTDAYYIGFYVSSPNTATQATVTVHYEPQAAAPAA